MYHPLLYIHSYVRWGILLLAIYLVVVGIQLWRSQTSESDKFKRYLSWYVILLDIQTLIGFIMYLFFSPQVQHAFQDFGGAMQRTDLRFWAVEHPLMMLIVLALGHIAKVKLNRAVDALRGIKTATIYIAISLAILLFVIPWPFSWIARPFFRF